MSELKEVFQHTLYIIEGWPCKLTWISIKIQADTVIITVMHTILIT